jgi:hypothetical protein
VDASTEEAREAELVRLQVVAAMAQVVLIARQMHEVMMRMAKVETVEMTEVETSETFEVPVAVEAKVMDVEPVEAATARVEREDSVLAVGRAAVVMVGAMARGVPVMAVVAVVAVAAVAAVVEVGKAAVEVAVAVAEEAYNLQFIPYHLTLMITDNADDMV